ncbi:uncharacterized protein LOC132284823 [Cornus florida]|uniref:uncharacterized protein LOC132284823 n=1 Tax=Cornus florida TaxID=4283 RepID=UPI00289E8004|nr:uncharacterized protein LOC132284823 [Cornus florida]XP_059642940.1 uncharacterized protein LOC132284823 [Cornus florida]
MLNFDEEEEVFFDTAEYILSEEPIVAKEDLVCSSLGYEIWMSELRSVKERREKLLSEVGLVEFTPSYGVVLAEKPEMMGLERIVECSGAVSSSCGSSVNCAAEELVCNSNKLNGEANCMIDEFDQDQFDKLNVALKPEGVPGYIFPSVQQFGQREAQGHAEECKSIDIDKKKFWSWWKSFTSKRRGDKGMDVSKVSKEISESLKVNRMKVRQNQKKCMEFTAVYVGQEIHAHEGSIRVMKFSPDGQFLASGGEDGVVRIWRVTLTDASHKNICAEGNFSSQGKEGKSSSGRKKSCHASIVIPDKGFWIEESPLQEFQGHTSNILDLAWSKSNRLLSSSEDKTARLWQVGCDECLSVFHHNNYVTCIQFNPVDENYFISGSIDGKVRIWGVSERRVVDWADIRDIVTAICYRPNGEGFVVGSIIGNCRFYETSGSNLQLNAQIHIQGRRKSSGNKITGIQFSPEESQRVMITSEDSKLRILDGIDVVHKYKGFTKSRSQMSASFTSTGRHLISVGEDSRVYIWNYDDLCVSSSKQTKSVRSCEHFFFDGVSVAIPWSGMGTEQNDLDCSSLQCCSPRHEQEEASSWIRDSKRFSLANWLSMDGSCRSSATWPEEKLPLWDVTVAEHDYRSRDSDDHHQHQNNSPNRAVLSATWGLVIVTAGWDGMIRTFQNYGLPVRI